MSNERAPTGEPPTPAMTLEHTPDPMCWCQPTLTYVDPVTDAQVWTHKRTNDAADYKRGYDDALAKMRDHIRSDADVEIAELTEALRRCEEGDEPL